MKYPNIKVEIAGSDGNAFAIMGKVSRALRKGNVALDEIEKYKNESMLGDYNQLLQTAMKWVDIS